MSERSNRVALERMIAALDGSFSDEHAALVEAALSLAEAVDAGEHCAGLPGESCGARTPSPAAMWKEYRQAVKDLMEVAAGGDDDDSAAFQQLVRAPVGDRSN